MRTAKPSTKSIENWRNAQKCFIAATVFLLCTLNVAGQEPVDSVTKSIFAQPGFKFYDSTEQTTEPDGLVKGYPLDTLFVRHSPAKAAIMSAVVPGLGQIYNRKYWKLPIVYAAIGISVERFIKFQNQYNRYRRAYIDLKDNDPYTNYHITLFEKLGVMPNQQMEQSLTKAKDNMRTYRDYAIVAVIAAYALNIIDANVDAHLIDFSLDDNISLNIRPTFLENDMGFKKIGLTLRFTF